MARVSHQFDARVTGRSSVLSYSRAAIGDVLQIRARKAKPLMKSPSGD
jgi:hypothetical protein